MEKKMVRVGRSSVESQKRVISAWSKIFAAYELPLPKGSLSDFFNELIEEADKHLVFARGERIAEVLDEVAHYIAFDGEADGNNALLAAGILEQARNVAWAVNEDREEDIWLGIND